MRAQPSTIDHPPSTFPARRPLWPGYAAESLSSVGTALLQVGIFFYTQHYFGWGIKQNLLLACGQGALYVIGSLASAGIAGRFGRRRSLIVIYAGMTALALCALVARSSPIMLLIALLGYTFIASLNWPAVESLVTAGADAHAMGHRVGMYNLCWSTTNAITFAVSGSIIEHWKVGMFLIPALAHTAGALVMLLNPGIEPPEDEASASAHVAPEPELIAKRKLAMWLARISLPATYVVIYSLMAMMPSLGVMQKLAPAAATLVGSTWMVARVLIFLILGITTWWHTRPSLLLGSAAVMLVAFIGVTLRPSDLGLPAPYAIDLSSMLAWQILLGAVMGVIYSGSLYFGMVLSEGSTEHGGYHEALIGVGSVIGPGAAAMVQQIYPNNVRAGVTAVSIVLAITVAAAAIAAFRASTKPNGSSL